jgi:hypothetical protein
MAKQHFSLLLASAALSVMIAFTSCHKNDREKDPDLQSSRDMSLALSSWNDLFRQVNILSSDMPELNASPGSPVNTSCATRTVNATQPGNTFPKTLVLDFGSANCQCPDGAMRRGQIRVNFSGNYWDSLSVITIRPYNYFINNNQVDSGTYVITNQGRNATGNNWFSQVLRNSGCSYTNGKTISLNASFKFERIAGASTPLVWDDEYLISGTGSGITTAGAPYTMYINTPLQLKLECPWMVSGNLYFCPGVLPNRFIDLGDGSCSSVSAIWIYGDKYLLNQY